MPRIKTVKEDSKVVRGGMVLDVYLTSLGHRTGYITIDSAKVAHLTDKQLNSLGSEEVTFLERGKKKTVIGIDSCHYNDRLDVQGVYENFGKERAELAEMLSIGRTGVGRDTRAMLSLIEDMAGSLEKLISKGNSSNRRKGFIVDREEYDEFLAFQEWKKKNGR